MTIWRRTPIQTARPTTTTSRPCRRRCGARCSNIMSIRPRSSGTGKDGRLTKDDVIAAAEAQKTGAPAQAGPAPQAKAPAPAARLRRRGQGSAAASASAAKSASRCRASARPSLSG